MNNLFQQELRKLFGDGEIVQSPHFTGRICLGELGKDLRVQAFFVTTGYANHYDALRIMLLNRTKGEVDSHLLRFQDIWGKKEIPGNPYLTEGVYPYFWVYSVIWEW